MPANSANKKTILYILIGVVAVALWGLPSSSSPAQRHRRLKSPRRRPKRWRPWNTKPSQKITAESDASHGNHGGA